MNFDINSWTPGLFGKMPAHGDFVSRGFSTDLTTALDQLMQSALNSAVADGANGASLLASFLPIVVHLRPGELCESGFLGLIQPSCDRVGRIFPICSGLEVPASAQRRPLAWPSGAFIEALCQTSFRAMRGGWSAQDWQQALATQWSWDELMRRDVPFQAALDATVPAVHVDHCDFWFEGPESRMSVRAQALCSRLSATLAVLGISLGPDGRPRAYWGSRSLLSTSHLAAVLDGRWEHWGWHLTEAEHQRAVDDDLIVTSSEWRVGHSSTPSTVWRPNAGHLDQALRQQEDPTTPPSRAFVTPV